MMDSELLILTVTALSIGFLHTLFGPDHYIPFIVMSKAGNWSTTRTVWITIACGLGHVGSSVILGLAGIALGVALSQLELIESVRGNIAAWFLIAFGLGYMIWGLRKAYRNRPHTHNHRHDDGTVHTHEHAHHHGHIHVHERSHQPNMTPWILFTIFVLGPCEPLIPILMYPASYQSTGTLLWIIFVFSSVTILTMVTAVLMIRYGIRLIPVNHLERYTHAMAGVAILLCGLAIQFLGL